MATSRKPRRASKKKRSVFEKKFHKVTEKIPSPLDVTIQNESEVIKAVQKDFETPDINITASAKPEPDSDCFKQAKQNFLGGIAVALEDMHESNSDPIPEFQEPAKETLLAKTLERVAKMLVVTPTGLAECLKAIGIEDTEEGLKKLKSEDLSREDLIRHISGWAWWGAKPTQAQFLGATVMLKNARSDDVIDNIRKDREQSDEIKALSTCWEQPDFSPENRQRAGLVDASMVTPGVVRSNDRDDRDAVIIKESESSSPFRGRRTSFVQSLGKPIRMTKEGEGEWEVVKDAENYPEKVIKMAKKVCKKAGKNDPVEEILGKPEKAEKALEINAPYDTTPVITIGRGKYLRRVNGAAAILQEKPEDVQGILEQSGIKLEMLDLPVMTVDGLIQILEPKCKVKDWGRLRNAAMILMGRDACLSYLNENKAKKTTGEIPYSFVVKKLDIPQMDDQALVQRYDTHREPEVSWELDRRAKGQPFIILSGKGEKGKEELDVELTVQMLRSARRKTNPDMLDEYEIKSNGTESGDIPVYKARDMDMTNRIVETCPVCREAMYKNWCEKCHRTMTAANQIVLPRPARLPKDTFKTEKVMVMVQVNGKPCGQFQIQPGMSTDRLEAEALAFPGTSGKIIRKVVVVPDKLVNFVV